ncbi:actin binding protein [Marasmius crinis-equi]|uniref:Actin binding protein n=1 Tax=Marasmius crinis-equi TaxID=585013 RepID=A0ABR3FTF7_9AGAR
MSSNLTVLRSAPPPPLPPPPPPPPPPPAAPAAPVVRETEPEPEPEPQHEPQGEEGQGPRAVALYDYDATEDNELTFKEGESIYDITAASDDWWHGRVADGREGLFPANYVQVEE